MKHYNAAKAIAKTLQEKGFIAYFAGGWVRDHILGKEADDIDIATTASPEQVVNIFPKTIPVGINFSIVIVVHEGVHCEVATFREESDYEDGRRPGKVVHASPKEDAHRRDFTINGMFFDPLTETIYDYVGGKVDLEKKMIRAIGDPHHRFFEDRLRMIRACRYSARFSFSIDENTADAIKAHAGELFPSVAIERVYDEFKKMTRDPHLFDALLLLYEFGLLKVIFHSFALITHKELEEKLKSPPKFPEYTYPILYLYELIKEPSLQCKLALCKHFKVSNKEMKITEELHKWESSIDLSPFELCTLYSHKDSDFCQAITALHERDQSKFNLFHQTKRKALKPHVERMKANAPLVTSADLMKHGIKAGKELGKLLKEAQIMAVNENLLTKEEVLARLIK